MLSDGLLHRPAWLGKPVPATLTLTGGALVLAGFLGINLSGSSTEPEEVRREGGWWMGCGCNCGI